MPADNSTVGRAVPQFEIAAALCRHVASQTRRCESRLRHYLGAGAFFKGRMDAPLKLGLDTMAQNCLQCPSATLILGFINH